MRFLVSVVMQCFWVPISTKENNRLRLWHSSRIDQLWIMAVTIQYRCINTVSVLNLGGKRDLDGGSMPRRWSNVSERITARKHTSKSKMTTGKQGISTAIEEHGILSWWTEYCSNLNNYETDTWLLTDTRWSACHHPIMLNIENMISLPFI